MQSMNWKQRHRAARNADGEQDGHFVAVSDLLTGILFLFILLLTGVVIGNRGTEGDMSTLSRRLADAQSDNKRLNAELALAREAVVHASAAMVEAQQRMEKVERTYAIEQSRLAENKVKRAQLLRRLAAQLRSRSYDVLLDEEEGVLRLPNDLLFGSGNVRIDQQGVDALEVLGGLLEKEIRCATSVPAGCPAGSTSFLEAVFVEGHTDSNPVRSGNRNPQYSDNWKLSTQRALEAFSAMTRASPSLKLLENADGRSVFGISGYADGRAVATNSTENGRERNRRIDLRFLLSGATPPSDDQRNKR